MPDLSRERRLGRRGFTAIAGIDEAGRGAWAGPVVAAAVILPPGGHAVQRRLAGVNDSKRLTPARREALYPAILETACAFGVGSAGPDEIDRQGILPATRAAMIRALAALRLAPDHLLIDALTLPQAAVPQVGIVRGDGLSLSIAAASIVAKVTRDRLMADLDARYPGYGFARHKGYGTAAHRAALERLGACAAHRRSYAPVAKISTQRREERKDFSAFSAPLPLCAFA